MRQAEEKELQTNRQNVFDFLGNFTYFDDETHFFLFNFRAASYFGSHSFGKKGPFLSDT
jgi:hypothetical protein